MADTVKTMKLHIHMNDTDISSVKYMTEQYRLSCNFVSQYIFDHDFPMSSVFPTTGRSCQKQRLQLCNRPKNEYNIPFSEHAGWQNQSHF